MKSMTCLSTLLCIAMFCTEADARRIKPSIPSKARQYITIETAQGELRRYPRPTVQDEATQEAARRAAEISSRIENCTERCYFNLLNFFADRDRTFSEKSRIEGVLYSLPSQLSDRDAEHLNDIFSNLNNIASVQWRTCIFYYAIRSIGWSNPLAQLNIRKLSRMLSNVFRDQFGPDHLVFDIMVEFDIDEYEEAQGLLQEMLNACAQPCTPISPG